MWVWTWICCQPTRDYPVWWWVFFVLFWFCVYFCRLKKKIKWDKHVFHVEQSRNSVSFCKCNGNEDWVSFPLIHCIGPEKSLPFSMYLSISNFTFSPLFTCPFHIFLFSSNILITPPFFMYLFLWLDFHHFLYIPLHTHSQTHQSQKNNYLRFDNIYSCTPYWQILTTNVLS